MNKEDLTFDYLPQKKEVHLYQHPKMFRINTDTGLLGNYLKIPFQARVLDIGTNNGALLLYASTFPYKELVGIDIQPLAIEIAKMNMELNHITNFQLYVKDIQTFEDPEGFDVIICNPPYFHQQTQNQNKDLALARHDTYLSLQTLFFKVFQLLKNTGAFYFIHRYDRYDEIVNELQHQHLKIVEKKEIYSKPNQPKTVLFTIKKT
ncbi:putative uncharacterized protein [Firmicutes bacterium CAG:631]|nr:putative uncharacterized protein [Firmicutes bacterium CAG:631]